MFFQFRQRALDNFSGGAVAAGYILNNSLERPGAVEMVRVKPVAAPDEADLMPGWLVEKQAPAFLTYLNVVRQTVRHRLVYPANAVDAQLFDHDFLDNLRFFGGLGLIGNDFWRFFFHFYLPEHSIKASPKSFYND